MPPKRFNGRGRKGGPRDKIDVAKTPVAERQRLFSECSDDQCSLCWNDIKVYAVGMCNHSICHVCMTRMRVLCSQKECAVCRQDMPQVFFSSKLCNYKELADQIMTKDARFQICFESDSLKRQYDDLLAHRCLMCEKEHPVTFRTFKQLDTHMKREHERFYCDLCVAQLKLYSHERRCYSRPELAMHRRKGDPDDSSHKGHPLCEYCEVRYFDDEELFRHLRRDHFYCHFCDADGIQEYYPHYRDLRDHFKADHFLCEEGGCLNEQFTHAFRTELDIKAHRLARHSGGLSKNEARQNRVIEVDFNLPSHDRHDRHRHHERRRSPVLLEPAPPVKNEVPDFTQDFPTLQGGQAATTKPSASAQGQEPVVNGSLATRLAHSSGRNTWATRGGGALALDDFPSLPGAPAPRPNNPAPKPYNPKKAEPKKDQPKAVADFPSLPATSSKTLYAFGAPANDAKNGWGKQQQKAEPKKVQSKAVADFPSLPTTSSKTLYAFGLPSNDAKNGWGKQQPNQPAKKGKNVAPPPDLDDYPDLGRASDNFAKMSVEQEKSGKKKKKKGGLMSAADLIFQASDDRGTSKSEPEKKAAAARAVTPPPPPPPASPKAVLKSPPGFSSSKRDSKPTQAQEPWRSRYTEPTNFGDRNARLLSTICSVFGGQKSLEFGTFKKLSHQFKADEIDADKYLRDCSGLVEDQTHLDKFMAELMALLPNIDKQNQLYSAYADQFPSSKARLSRCDKCGQLLAETDRRTHKQTHELDQEFPAL